MTSILSDNLIISIKGAGEFASAVAWRLFMANIRKILMLEAPSPTAVRREVAFADAVHGGNKTVEGVEATLARGTRQIEKAWNDEKIALIVDPECRMLETIRPHVLVDAILAKKNLGTRIDDADLVIGLGPGFYAGRDVHFVIETNRGHNLGKIIVSGEAEPNTGVPGAVCGITENRVLRAPAEGDFRDRVTIGSRVTIGDIIGWVSNVVVRSRIEGVLRGLIRAGTHVPKGLKIGDVDPRGDSDYCFTISDKARTISGSVLEAVLRVYNR